jgi:putative sigma-54 modulation protein
MHITVTARRFRAHDEIKDHATDAVKRLGKFYDGIVHADVILSFERVTKSVKAAEINLQVYGHVLTARAKSDEFGKSIDAAVEKLGIQLEKYKAKLRAKDKGKGRSMRQKS